MINQLYFQFLKCINSNAVYSEATVTGSKTWVLSVQQDKKLNAFDIKSFVDYRMINGFTLSAI